MDGAAYLPQYIDTANNFASELKKYKDNINNIEEFILFVEQSYDAMERLLFSALENNELTQDEYDNIMKQLYAAKQDYIKKVGIILSRKSF